MEREMKVPHPRERRSHLAPCKKAYLVKNVRMRTTLVLSHLDKGITVTERGGPVSSCDFIASAPGRVLGVA